MLSSENLKIVKALIDSASVEAESARMARVTWRWAVVNASEALDMRTARLWTTDDIVERISEAIDKADDWGRENLDHIRQYFVLADRAVWSHCDLLIAFTRLLDSADADPLEWHPVASQRGEAC